MEKIVQKTPNWAQVFMTAYLLWVTGATSQKVYFDCGAVVDVVDVRGLILSPGFPYNYSSGTHCVWQFFVPAGYRLVMEMLDFDVFESHDIIARSLSNPLRGVEEEEVVYDRATPTPRGAIDGDPPKGPALQAPLGGTPKASQMPQKEVVKQVVVVQEQSTKMEMAKVSNSAKWTAESPPAPASPPTQLYPQSPSEMENYISHQAIRGDGVPDLRVAAASSRPEYEATPTLTSTPSSSTDTEATSPETQQPVMDACPHDVLYISDLITFSTRFCGPNKPMGHQLAFGSQTEMVEVIMELITTTPWGRGFALLFRYHNRTELGDRRLLAPPATGKIDALLAAVCGASFFAVVLTSALCIIFRPKLCVKRASTSSSNSSELQEGVPSSGGDASELQLVPPNQTDLEVPANDEDHEHTPGPGRLYSGSPISAGADISQNSELELSPDGLTELDLGTDEVFVISSGPSTSTRLPFCPYTQRERFLRHSDTGPGPGCDWLSPASPGDLPSGGRGSQGGGASSTRPRAWSVRTFQDFLPLQRKWRSWNSTSPFTKLVDSAPAGPCKVFSDTHLETGNQSDSSTSNASFPLAQPAQRQRRLNSVSNLRRSRFAAPCFSLLSGPVENGKAPTGPQPHCQAPPSEPTNGSLCRPPQAENQGGGKPWEFPGEGEHVSVPVFAISEEEDRQPLVLAEHLGQSPEPLLNGPGRSPAPLLNGLGQEPYGGKTQAGGRSPGQSASPSVSSANGSLLSRARSDQRPWGSHAPSGDDPSHPSHSPRDAEVRELKSSLMYSTANQIKPSSLSQSTVPCSVVGKDM
ncbi:hypothetical protein SKAU_G00009780 [Synaphobranchus kaupii]|uniref:CUB domain-containing protein n=1 Tax=Synaphobranchus kaupii TaxID=118154 RepID=A0A9Q1GAU6_SYNKA|nr:hypothetical protein SKAU_G00009780 [Synaphobranchus kaupii]